MMLSDVCNVILQNQLDNPFANFSKSSKMAHVELQPEMIAGVGLEN